jgi:hypothetical protein
MPAFKDVEELNKVMLALWQAIEADADISARLLLSKISIRFCYREPESNLTIDCSDGQKMKILVSDSERSPIVEMFMKAEFAHDFWLGKVNVPLALISGKIASRGPVNTALALLPVIKPAFAFYPDIYKTVTGRGVADC